ncbi:MAG: discoidin domain-containing protein [Opitutaceae bacterium]
MTKPSRVALAAIFLSASGLPSGLQALPIVNTPDPEISEVFQGNWVNTLKPCEIQSGNPDQRPWAIEAADQYPGWYPAIDAKYQTRSYLFCEKNLALVLTGWQYTTNICRSADGGVMMLEDQHFAPTAAFRAGTTFPHPALDAKSISYPLRATATIDYILTGDMIFRFSQDRAWLAENIPHLRDAARWLEGWIDDQGLLDSEDYDHDCVMRRGTDGTAQAAAFQAFRKLAAMEDLLGNVAERDHDEQVARVLGEGARRILWDPKLGYFYEYVETNNIARSDRLGFIGGVSSELDRKHPAAKAIDGVLGYGLDLFTPMGVGAPGGAGMREWAAKGETTGAWIQVNLEQPTAICRVILYNRQDVKIQPGEAFAAGRLDFSDGSTVPVVFGPGVHSRAVIPFPSRTVTWVRFIGGQMQGEGSGNAGLAEFVINPTAEAYLKHTHGMSDTNFALVGYGVADEAQAQSVWRYFKAHEDAFYLYKGVAYPTWTTESPESYGPDELVIGLPAAVGLSNKDRTAFARPWRHDVWMRRRMGDADGIYRTITWVNNLYHLGNGVYGERYGIGRYCRGDEGEYYPLSARKYAEYPAEYNATVVGEIVMGVSADIHGTIVVDPCVPASWYQSGFGIENPGILQDRDLGYTYGAGQVRGWIKGKPGKQAVRLLLPPNVKAAQVLQDGQAIPHTEAGRYTAFTLDLAAGKTHTFSVESAN